MRPRACSTAIRADSPVPVAERSSRPGATTTAFRVHRPHSAPRLGQLDDADARDLRVLRVDARELLARGIANQLADAAQLSRLARLELEAERGGIRDRVPHAAVGDVDGDRAEPRNVEPGIELPDERRHVGQLDTVDTPLAARGSNLDGPRRRLEPQRRLGLAQLDHPGLEQDGGDADRVRARHRRIFGRLHDDEAGIAISACRRDDEVGVHGDTPARLAQKHSPERIVRAEREHLVEDGLPRWGQDPADDHVADLAAGVAADDRDHPAAAHDL